MLLLQNIVEFLVNLPLAKEKILDNIDAKISRG